MVFGMVYLVMHVHREGSEIMIGCPCVTLALWTDTLVIQQRTGGGAHGACAAYVSRLSGALSASQQQFQQLSMPGHTSIERQVWFIL